MPRTGACAGDHTRVRCTRRCERAGAWADVVRMVRKRAVRAHARTGSVSKTIVQLLMRGLSMCRLSKADLARWARVGERTGGDAAVLMGAAMQAACTHGLKQQVEQCGRGWLLACKKVPATMCRRAGACPWRWGMRWQRACLAAVARRAAAAAQRQCHGERGVGAREHSGHLVAIPCSGRLMKMF